MVINVFIIVVTKKNIFFEREKCIIVNKDDNNIMDIFFKHNDNSNSCMILSYNIQLRSFILSNC